MNVDNPTPDDVIIIDDFYPDPYLVREEALVQTYQDPPGSTARLAKTALSTEFANKQMLNQLSKQFSDPNVNRYVILFRYSLEGSIKKTFCHADSCSYAGIVYLSLPEHCKGGTSFYVHKPTGDYFWNPENGYRYDICDASQWEQVRSINMAFNCMAFYPGHLFHAITPDFFGTEIANARLTQNLFAYRIGDSGN